MHFGLYPGADALGTDTALQGTACNSVRRGGVRICCCGLSAGMEARFRAGMWVANLTAVAIALSLGIASHQLLAFIAVVLLMVLIGEYAAGTPNCESGVRVLVALAADAAVWALLYIYSSPESTRGGLSGAGATGSRCLRRGWAYF